MNLMTVEDGKFLGGVAGQGIEVLDVWTEQKGKYDVVQFRVKLASILNSTYKSEDDDNDYTPIEEGVAVVTVFVPDPASDKYEKNLQNLNKTLSILSGQDVEGDDAWFEAVTSDGDLHQAILENSAKAKVYVQNKHKNGYAHIDFRFGVSNVAKPTLEEFKARMAAKRAEASTF